MNVKSLFEVNNFTTEPSSPVRGSFGTFPVKSTEEQRAKVFAKTPCEAEKEERKKERKKEKRKKDK